MRLIVSAGMVWIVMAVGSVNAAENNKTAGIPCVALPDMLESCTEYRCEAPHPRNVTEQLVHEVKGFDEDGKCHHIQTTPSEGLLDCRYSEETRNLMARLMRVATRPSIQDSEKLGKAFKVECVVQ